MDYRDADGYFQEDVLRVLGRSGIAPSGAAAGGELPALPPYGGGLRSSIFDDAESPLTLSPSPSPSPSLSSASSDTFSDASYDADAEWEDAKRMLYVAFVGTALPMALRYIGRRATFAVWTRLLTAYFKA
ncbi:hypothetical protein H4R18_002322 [Coemansia javaensis]|uniref:Uncharacterized protein n=1 Tax=Coemansia javaensis TaxID=2761396 RepID=A0A9W8HI01_9FUNG|nr:hypothetical protein H4R18_002322 [Coemansia javaensis]